MKSKLTTIRTKVIDAIIEHSGDELETDDLINIAKETDEQVIDRLINILDWYVNEINN